MLTENLGVFMQDVSCYLCGSTDRQVVARQTFTDNYLGLIDPSFQGADRTIVACDECGLVYRAPQLDDRDLKVLYDHFRDASFRGETPDQYFDRIDALPDAESENFQKIVWLEQRIPDVLAKGGAILDIGCGGGVFLAKFVRHFPKWTGAGVEPTVSFAELAARRTGMTVAADSYRPGLLPQKFNLICLIQVLEHVLDPIGFLQGVRRDMAPKGWLYLESPDVSDFGILPFDHDRYHAQHVYIYSLPLLEYIFAKAGFVIQHSSIETTVRDKRNVVILAQAGEDIGEVPTVPDFPLEDAKDLVRRANSSAAQA
ncbi:MAG TPA: class I SAM-dependent methyltransferase [Gemmatimonadaceae bacterium]|jgi:2-polyprenyl-3-methyl-5-hydroxy-6-metoxy-1,4-benzoquinol methylase